jgi:hypothetical protein
MNLSTSIAVCALCACAADPNPEATTSRSADAACGAIDPHKDFISNFANACYEIALPSGSGGGFAGNADATYFQLGYLGGTAALAPGYELVIFSPSFANARYSSIEVNDAHGTLSPDLERHAEDIMPLTSGVLNPLAIGQHYVPGIAYAVRISLGSELAAESALSPGCGGGATTLDEVAPIDASHVHANSYVTYDNTVVNLSWHGVPGLPDHADNAINTGGVIFVRDYHTLGTPPPVYGFVRDTTTGCAVRAADAIAAGYVSKAGALGMNASQVFAHERYSNAVPPRTCYPADPGNADESFRAHPYVPGPNIDAAYGGPPITTLVKRAQARKELIEVKLAMPTYPATPCADGNCVRTGNEQMRERVISLMNGTVTLASWNDTDFPLDADRHADLLINVTPGLAPPSPLGAGYKYVDATAIAGFTTATAINVRDVIPNPSFGCSFWNVPFNHGEVGQMGEYGLVTSLIAPANVPATPMPDARTDTCALPPPAPVTCP